MGRTPKYSLHLQFQESKSPSRIENPSTPISKSLTDVRLPQDLIFEILLHLPVKSLLKFKCVSKPWLSLISSPQFIKCHCCISSIEGEYLNHQLLVTTLNDPIPAIKLCSLYSALHEPSTLVIYDIEYPSQRPDHYPWIVGVVNGLVCLASLAINANDLFLWNPVLRKYKHLPSSDVSWGPPCKVVNYGFGYDELNDDYKVVVLLSVYDCVGGWKTKEVKIYSLRADSWRSIEDLKCFPPTYDIGLYANGKIYWFAHELADSTPIRKIVDSIPKIVSLDMVTGKYGELPCPDDESDDYKWKFIVVGGRACWLCDYHKTKVDLWVMDNNGVKESRCKVVSIPYDPLTPYSHHQVLCILSNGEIVLENGYRLLVYHSKNKEFRKIKLGGFSSSSYCKVLVYVESLVSPN